MTPVIVITVVQAPQIAEDKLDDIFGMFIRVTGSNTFIDLSLILNDEGDNVAVLQLCTMSWKDIDY